MDNQFKAVCGKIKELREKMKTNFNTDKSNKTHQIKEALPVIDGTAKDTVKPSRVAGRHLKNNKSLKDAMGALKAFFAPDRKTGKIRFSSVVSIAVAAVLVPVIAVSANTGMDNTAASAANLPKQSETVKAAKVISQMPVAVPVSTGEEAVPEENAPISIDEPQNVQTEEPELKEWIEDGEGQILEQEGIVVEGLTVDETIPPEEQYLSLEPETTHPDVIKLQQRLMELNYMDNDEPTEYYGPMTQRAVSYFQRKHELDIDGVAGVQTQELLFSEDAKSYSVTVGAEGVDVSGIQERLNELGYDVGVTGYFGTDTEEGVKYFQRMNGLDDDGSVGADTKDLLFSENAEPAEQKKQESAGGSNSSSGGSKSSGSSESKSSESSGSSGGGGGGSTSHTANPGSVSAFLDAAYAQVGKPYVTGGKGPDSFDCSGFVYYALQQSGNGIGYMTSGGWAGSGYATVSSMSDLQPGDIICFSGHVGIYAGGGTMIDASSSKGQVVVRDCTGSWSRNNFICGKRPL